MTRFYFCSTAYLLFFIFDSKIVKSVYARYFTTLLSPRVTVPDPANAPLLTLDLGSVRGFSITRPSRSAGEPCRRRDGYDELAQKSATQL
jgi:hypothetical protein